jgi:presenilin-like A22 family membrane protease
VLLVVGLVLFAIGLNATDSVTEDISEGLTGKFTDKTTWYLLGGLAMALAGGAMSLFGGKTRSA